MRRSSAFAPVAVAFLLLTTAGLTAGPQAEPSAAELRTAIDRLGAFDYPIRTEAARVVRRTPAGVAAPALEQAVRSHKDQYVRFRALVLLTGLGRPETGGVVRSVIADKNDRLRTVAYQWLEHHPDPGALRALLDALPNEQSEFVRPALTRAIAAHGTDEAAQQALLPLVSRGEDLFRGALIEALGDYNGRYALSQLTDVAKLDGPLQDDAITAIGKIGDVSVRPILAGLQKSASDEVQPTISASLCLIGVNCAAQEAYLLKVLAFSGAHEDEQPLLRGVVHALGMLAMRGRENALSALLDAGVPAREPARTAIALGVGLVALRAPSLFLKTLEARTDAAGSADLILDAFDMLSEDFEEERFYAAMRQAYWSAPAGSATHRAAELLIEKLEF